MSANRNYSSVARLAALTAGVTNSATTLPVDVATGFPTVPFTMVVDPGRSAEEIVTVTAVVGLNLTVLRGQDGTAGQPHDAGASLRHMATARDFREAAEHIGLTAGIHGASGTVVGTTDGQVLDNKTFQALVTDHTALIVKAASGQAAALMSVQDSAGTALATWLVSGRLTAPGVDANRSTFTASTAGQLPLLARGAASQTANLFEVRDSTDATLALFNAAGALTAAGVVTGNGSASVSSLIVNCAASQTAPAVAVRSSAAVEVAGVTGQSTGFQLYHGGSASNVVPLRMHGGTAAATITSGGSSIIVTVDLTAYGFTVTPIVTCGLINTASDNTAKRAATNISALSSTSVSFRVFQTEGTNLTITQAYTVHYTAVQWATGSAGG